MGYTLYYFELRAVVEPIRQLFKLAGKDFEDKRFTFPEWLGENSPKKTMPFGQLPVLELADGTKLAQSQAIARYLSKEFGGILWGSNNVEAAEIDALIDQYKEYYNEIRKFYYTNMGVMQGDLEELYKDVFLPAADKFYGFIEKKLDASKSGFLVGSELSYADLLVADHLVTLQNIKPEYLKDHPKLTAYKEKVYSNEILKKWLAERPETAM
ncbi:unnamed protein product, partial [Mesorhabditis spiculigera]